MIKRQMVHDIVKQTFVLSLLYRNIFKIFNNGHDINPINHRIHPIILWCFKYDDWHVQHTHTILGRSMQGSYYGLWYRFNCGSIAIIWWSYWWSQKMYREQTKLFSHTDVVFYSSNSHTSIVLVVMGSVFCQRSGEKDHDLMVLLQSWKIGAICCDWEHWQKWSAQCDLGLSNFPPGEKYTHTFSFFPMLPCIIFTFIFL